MNIFITTLQHPCNCYTFIPIKVVNTSDSSHQQKNSLLSEHSSKYCANLYCIFIHFHNIPTHLLLPFHSTFS